MEMIVNFDGNKWKIEKLLLSSSGGGDEGQVKEEIFSSKCQLGFEEEEEGNWFSMSGNRMRHEGSAILRIRRKVVTIWKEMDTVCMRTVGMSYHVDRIAVNV